MVFNYTDLELTLTVDQGYLDKLEDVYVSIETEDTKLSIRADPDGIDPEAGTVKIDLSQELTGKLQGKAIIQVNGFINGKRWASEQGTIMFRRNLLEKVVEP